MAAPKSPRHAVSEYLDYCTGHGLGRIKNTPYTVLKLFWALALMTAAAFVAFQVTRLTQTWLSQPIKTTLELETPDTVRFPAVTLCNLNPLQFRKVLENEEMVTAIRELSELYNISLSQFGLDTSPEIVDGNDTSFHLNNEGFINFDLDSVAFEALEHFRLLMNSLQPWQISELSQDPSEFLVDCVFAGATCDVDHFNIYWSWHYGECLDFGSLDFEEKHDMDLNVSTFGKDYGLTVTLNVDQANYLPFLIESTGVLVKIHPHTEPPSENDLSIVASVGFKTDIGLRKLSENRIPGTKNRCSAGIEYYSVVDCQQFCMEKIIKEECHCDYGYHLPDNDLEACVTRQDSQCIQNIRQSLANTIGERCKPCIEPCNQELYVHTVTTSSWPANHYLPLLMKRLNRYQSVRNLSDTQSQSDYIRENLVQIQIYLSTFTIDKLVEESSYSDENFVSDIGGQLGLWVGFSVLSLCEIIELLILIIDTFRKRHVQPTTDDVIEMT